MNPLRVHLNRLVRRPREAARFYIDLARFGDRPRRMGQPPPAKQVIVLAPHPDDEAIGCGGVIQLYRMVGTPVTVIFISDGGRGGSPPGIPGRLGELAHEERLGVTRRLEAQQAGSVLGVSEQVFLDLPDGSVSASAENVDRLLVQLSRLRPDVVFLPFMIDQHPDHIATNALFLEAAGRLPDAERIQCWGYEVWTPLYANRIVDITPTAEAKWQALRQYDSQNQSLDYLASTQGLNAFRQRAGYKGEGYAEAFFAASLSDYRTLFLQLPESSQWLAGASTR